MAQRSRTRQEDSSRVLSAIIELSLDEQSAQKFRQDTTDIKAQLQTVNEQVAALNTQLKAGGEGLEEGSFGYAWLNLQLKDAKEQAATLTQELTDRTNKAVLQVSQNLEQSAKRTHELATSVSQRGGKMADIGTDILGGAFAPMQQLQSMTSLTGMMNTYLQQVGMAGEAGRQWQGSLERIRESQTKIGAEVAESLVPFMEIVAGLAERAAVFVEAHPELVQAFATAGGILVSVGMLTKLISSGIQLVADAKTLAAAALQSQAAQTMLQAAGIQQAAAATGATGGAAVGALGGIAQALPYLAVTAGAIYVGGEIADKLAGQLGPQIYGSDEWEKWRGDEPALVKAVGVIREMGGAAAATFGGLGAELQDLLGFHDAADRSRQNVAELSMAIAGWTDEMGKSTEAVKEATGVLTQAELDAYIDYRRRAAVADERLSEETLKVKEDTNKRLLEAEEQYGQARRDAIKSLYARWAAEDEQAAWNTYLQKRRQEFSDQVALEKHLESIAEREKEYRENETKAIDDHSRRLAEMEEDHLKSLVKMRRDYEEQQEETIRQRDAIAYLRNLRQYGRNLRDREEQYQDQVGDEKKRHAEVMVERAKQHSESMTQMRRNWEKQFEERERQQEFDRRLQAEDLAHRRSLERRALNERLSEMQRSHQDELREINAQGQARLSTLQLSHQKEITTLNQQLASKLFDEVTLRQEFYAQMELDAKAWMSRYRGILHPYPLLTSPTPSSGGTAGPAPTPRTGGGGAFLPGALQGGGYASAGHYMLGEAGDEFVLSNPTTAALERIMGGTLTQGRLLAAASGRSVTIQQTGWQFAPGMGAADRQWFKKAAYEAALEAVEQVNRGF